ncbi:DUF4214 domain-containing protein [Methylobacterium trifolii]
MSRDEIIKSLLPIESDLVFLGELYEMTLRRLPDKDGLQFYYQKLVDGVPRADLIDIFLNSDEFKGLS